MKILYLQNSKDLEEWREFRYHDLEELRPEFERRGIFLGAGVSIGNFSYIGKESSLHAGVRLGDGVTIDPRSIVCRDSTVGDESVVSSRACVGRGCRLGKEVFLAPGAVLQGSDTLDDQVQVGMNTHIAPQVTIGASTVISDNNRIGGDRPMTIGKKVWIGVNNTIRPCEVPDRVQVGRCNTINRDCALAPAARIGSFSFVEQGGRSWRNQNTEVETADCRKAELRLAMDNFGFRKSVGLPCLGSDTLEDQEGNQDLE